MVRSQGCPVRCWRGNALDLVTRRLQEFHGQVVQVYASWVVLYVLVAKILNIWKSEFMSIGHSMPDPSQVGLWQLGYWKAGRHGWDWGTAMARVFFWGLGTHWEAAKIQMLPDGSVKSKLLMAFEEIFGDFHWYKTTVYICLPVHVTVTFSLPPAEHRGPASCSTLIPACPCDCRARLRWSWRMAPTMRSGRRCWAHEVMISTKNLIDVH